MGKRFRHIMMKILCKTKKRQRNDRRQSSLISLKLLRSVSTSTVQANDSPIALQASFSFDVGSNPNQHSIRTTTKISECRPGSGKLQRCITWAPGDYNPLWKGVNQEPVKFTNIELPESDSE